MKQGAVLVGVSRGWFLRRPFYYRTVMQSSLGELGSRYCSERRLGGSMLDTTEGKNIGLR